MKYQEVRSAVENFRNAYLEMTEIWATDDGMDVLDSLESLQSYPFDKSFNELEVSKWTDRLLNTINDANKLKTPRGTFKIAEQFANSSEARKNDYYIYFTADDGVTDIYTKHLDEYHCLFGIVVRDR